MIGEKSPRLESFFFSGVVLFAYGSFVLICGWAEAGSATSGPLTV
jgi:hypothetical protein